MITWRRWLSSAFLTVLPLWCQADDIGLDVNRDGLIQLERHPHIPADKTTPDRPFIFWVNDDQDDLEFYETWPIERPDHSTPDIDSVRDAEDLYPLWIGTGGQSSVDAARVSFSWEVSDAEFPALNVFRSADPTCTNQHLIREAIAEQQLTETYRRMIGSVRVGAGLQVPAAGLGPPAEAPHGLGYCVLIEGASAGAGNLLVQLQDAQGSVLSRGEIAIELHPVKSLYQRARIDWPEHIQPPWTYAPEQPPEPDLGWVEDVQGIEFGAPWYEDKHVLVWVYGWQSEGEAGYLSATVKGGETIFKRLWHRGYHGRLVLLHWPTVKPKLAYGLFQSEYRAYKAGPALKDLVHSQPAGRTVHVTAHSLGNVVLTEALRLGMQAEDAMFQVGAVPAGSLDPSERLVLPEMRSLETPDAAEEFGYRGYLRSSATRLYNMYNPFDHTWIGWNLAQHLMKPTHEPGARYEFNPEAELGQRYLLRYKVPESEDWISRPVTDPHEVMAFIARSKTHPIGGEARLRGLIRHRYDIGRPPYSFGHGHTVGWSWPLHRTANYFNLVLDAFNIAYKSALR